MRVCVLLLGVWGGLGLVLGLLILFFVLLSLLLIWFILAMDCRHLGLLVAVCVRCLYCVDLVPDGAIVLGYLPGHGVGRDCGLH